MNILNDPLPMTHLRRRELMNVESEISHGSLASLLLMRDRVDDELARLLLHQVERRGLRLLCVLLSVDFVPGKISMTERVGN